MSSRKFLSASAVGIAGIILVGTLTAVPAHADDPLQPIIQTIERDRQKACPNSGILSYDKKLEAIAQAYARSEKIADASTPPPGYNGLLPFLGAGDPQAQAINRAYEHRVITNPQGPTAGQTIGTCREFAYGVGFVRWDNRSVDVVTIVFGELTPPRHPASIQLKPGVGSFYISGSGFSQNTTVTVTFNYYPGNGVTTNYGVPSMPHADSGGNFATIVPVPTMTSPHGRLDVEATDNGGLSTKKSIQF